MNCVYIIEGFNSFDEMAKLSFDEYRIVDISSIQAHLQLQNNFYMSPKFCSILIYLLFKNLNLLCMASG